MNEAGIISELEALGVRLWVEGGQLRYRGPAGALTERHRDLLRIHKAALVEHLALQDGTGVHADPDNRFMPFPLTDVQAAYLVGRGKAYEYGGVGCHGYVELELPRADPVRLERAWHMLIRRHDMLRAVVSQDGSQQVLAEVDMPALPVRDMCGQPDADVATAIGQARAEMSARCYAPDQWPLHELRLTQTGCGSLLHLSIDLLIADFVSIQVMLSELDHLYHRPEVELPPIGVTFRDVVLARRAGQDHATAAARRDRDRAYWLERIAEMPGPPELPVIERASGGSPPVFVRHQFRLSPQAWRSLCKTAQSRKVTPSSVVMAAFAEVVGRWSRRPDFCLNVTVLGRPALHADIDHLIGDFTSVNVLAVTPTVAGTFSDRAAALQVRLWEDLDHASFSGIEVLREMGRRPDLRGTILPVVFTSTIGVGGKNAIDGEFMTGARLAYGITQTPQVWLDCQVAERGGALHVNWDVRDGIFPERLVEQALAAFGALLETLAAGSAAWQAVTPVSLPATVLECRKRVNATASPMPQGLLQDGVLHSVRTRSNATALVCGGASVSYASLAGYALAVHGALNRAGARPGDRVAVVIDKGLDQIAAVLGTLMAGGVYLPIDTSQPAARRDMILADAGVRHVLVQSHHAAASWPQGITVIGVDGLDATPSCGEALPAAPVTADQLAYIIYTSGTTGRPKGVMISHRAALNTITDINVRFGVGPDDRVLGLASLSFDLSVYDIFGTLSAGGTLVLPDPHRGSDPSHWAGLMAAHDVSIWNSVPAQMQMLMSYLESEPGAGLRSLRLAMLSGDWIPVTLPGAIRARCPAVRVVSLGGATEAAIWSIWHDIGEVEAGARSIPYGVPLANQIFHVLDARLAPCPDWTAGELYIGGAGLAEGYAGDCERTAERFIVHPGTGERLYRTGDMGRYRPDGVIEFLGREDTQVKIRGHRIELSEIEAVLQQHPRIAQSAVVLCGKTAVDRRLAAFVEPVAQPRREDEEFASRLAIAARKAGDESIATLDGGAFRRWVEAADDIARLDMLAALRGAGLFADVRTDHDLAEIVERSGSAPRHQRLLRRWLRVLQQAGWLDQDARNGRYRMIREPADGEAERVWRELQDLERQVGYSDELLRYLRESSAHLAGLLRGEVDPLDLLFPQGRLDTAVAAYNDNLVNRCMNAVACAAVREIATARKSRNDSAYPLRVLEVGAGVGGTSRALIPALADFATDYLYSDVSPFFLNEARARYAENSWVRYGLFDLNQDYVPQGLTAGSWDVIVCSNVLHNAKHAPSVLQRLREMGAPGCVLVIIEATRENAALMTSMEFQTGLSGFVDERAALDQTFFTREQWERLFSDAGAGLMCCYPPPEDALACVGQAVFVARFPVETAVLHEEELRAYLHSRLPDYMVPVRLEWLNPLPLSRNGKIDRALLRQRAEAADHPAAASVADRPLNDLEVRVANIWAAALGRDGIGREEDFFQAGGDSLLVAQVVARMREGLPEARRWEWDRLMRDVLRAPTVAAIAAALRKGAGIGAGVTGRVAESPLLSLAPARRPDDTVHVLLHDGSGTLAPYRALLPLLRGNGARKGEIVGLTVPDARTYLERDPGRLIQDLASEYAALLTAHGGNRFHLIGYCMGGLLATEVGRVLLEAGVPIDPVTVISSDRFRYRIDDDLLLERAFGGLLGADLAAAGHDVDDRAMERALCALRTRHGEHLPEGCLQRLDGDLDEVGDCYRRLSRKTPMERLSALAATVSAKAWEVKDAEIGALFDVFRHSLRAVALYQPEPFAGDLHLLQESEALYFLPGLQPDMKTFWTEVALGDMRMERIAGNHLSCLQSPHVGAVVSRIFAGLAA